MVGDVLCYVDDMLPLLRDILYCNSVIDSNKRKIVYV